jgi:predicted DNA-binding protein
MKLPRTILAKQVQICTLLPPVLVRDLKKLSAVTGTSMATYVREGLKMVLEKHAAVLRKEK